MALTEREREILRLSAGGMNDYRIARRLHSYTNSVKRSRLNALKKIERARVDLEFTEIMKLKPHPRD
jgi:DNA-binding NarL/FixJ family response regulator